MKKPKNFKTALKHRNAQYKKWERLQKQADRMKSKIIDLEHWCNHLRSWGDKFERKFHFSINFSGMED